MKPNFALSLSFEGISLLCRVKDGWHVLGEVALSAEDLAGDLEKLRALAEGLDGPDFVSKLVLPNDQIKYLLIDSGRGPHAKRKAAAAKALENETPYQVADLAFDVVADGRKTHVAAVARETLAEAEAFAVEHRFNPVSFAAIPANDGFPSEPNFGLTRAAGKLLNGAILDQDDTVIEITGSGPIVPEAPLETIQAPEEIMPEPEEAIPEPEQIEPEPALEPQSPTEPATENPSQDDIPADLPVVSAFSSIRARRDDTGQDAAPSLGSAERSVAGTNAPGLPAAGDQGPHADEVLRFDPAKVIAGLKTDPDFPEIEPVEIPPEDSGSFFSRRSGHIPSGIDTEPVPQPKANSPAASGKPRENERRRMTIFGAREADIGGKPRHLGLILTVILLIFLAGVAVWATMFLEDGLAGLLRREPVPQIAELEVESTQIEALDAEAAPVETAVLAPVNVDSLTDSAEIEAMADDAEAWTDSGEIEAADAMMYPSAPSEFEAEARYAVTGIWERAPQQSNTPQLGSTETLYMTSIDRLLGVRDAVALPDEAVFVSRDWRLPRQSSPAPAGTTFDLDERGLVRATPQGTMSPLGVMVYLGKPAVLPKAFPERKPALGKKFSPEAMAKLAAKRPKVRPDNLIEQNERASLGGRTLQELVKVRPRLRPELEKAEEEKDTTPTKLAVLASARPRPRPSNFAQIVARATPSDPVVATPVAATVTPSIPTSASVARQATIQNAIALNKISLIGVYGTTSDRRALVRMSNGRFKKVQVGDRIDGGKVAAISDTELRYIKSGKNVVLKMPKG